MLDAKEIKQLRDLQRKEKKIPDPLTSFQIDEIEARVSETFDKHPEAIKALMEAYSTYTEKLQKIACDNALLIGEVKRLRALVKELK